FRGRRPEGRRSSSQCEHFDPPGKSRLGQEEEGTSHGLVPSIFVSRCATMAPVSFWHHIPQPIIGLSPMDGVTDLAFRYIVARYGKPDVQVTEFVSVDEVCHGVEAAWQQLRYAEVERPIVAQIYGADPDKFYQVAQIACELGFDGVDINMGCPSKNVSARGCGAALIRNPPLAREIIQAGQAGVADSDAGHRVLPV